MNYFQFHIGDYSAATAHLSLLEDAIYGRLLRRYYTDEKPIPADLSAASRLVGARSEEEREAVRVVLAEFFKLTEDGWRNSRADREIDAYHRMKKGGANGASKRWAKGGDGEAMPTPCPPHRQANANQEPVTINQEPAKKEQGARATRLPQDWQPSPDELAWARANRPELDALAEADKFRDYWTAKNRDAAKLDWPATWRNWIRNSHAPPRRGTPNAAPSKQMQGLANILGLTHENDDSARLVLDLNPTGFGADVRQLPSGFPRG